MENEATFYEFLVAYIKITRGHGLTGETSERDTAYAIDKMPQSEFAAVLSDYITARFGEAEESEDDD